MSSTSRLCEEEKGTSYWKLPLHYSDVPQEGDIITLNDIIITLNEEGDTVRWCI